MTAGVICDNRKTNTYKKRIEEEGFEIIDESPFTFDTTMIKVKVADHQENKKLQILLTTLEKQYSLRGREN